jgi:hypothetical protein
VWQGRAGNCAPYAYLFLDARAVPVAMQRLGFESLIASRASAERDAVCAMVAARILAPHTKLATTRWWHTTTLAEEYGVLGTDEADLYAAMDWLLERQGAIEKKLAARHLSEGALALYAPTEACRHPESFKSLKVHLQPYGQRRATLL